MLKAMENLLPLVRFSGNTCRKSIWSSFIFLNFLLIGPLYAQDVTNNGQITVVGTVTNASGEPLLAVNILVEGTDSGTITDDEGKYSISVAKGGRLIFSFLGFESQTIS